MSEALLIANIEIRTLGKKVRHMDGFPDELGHGDSIELPTHKVAKLFIEKNEDGFFLFRATSQGTIISDTWHASVQDAMEQAAFEYGEAVGPWRKAADDESLPSQK